MIVDLPLSELLKPGWRVGFDSRVFIYVSGQYNAWKRKTSSIELLLNKTANPESVRTIQNEHKMFVYSVFISRSLQSLWLDLMTDTKTIRI